MKNLFLVAVILSSFLVACGGETDSIDYPEIVTEGAPDPGAPIPMNENGEEAQGCSTGSWGYHCTGYVGGCYGYCRYFGKSVSFFRYFDTGYYGVTVCMCR